MDHMQNNQTCNLLNGSEVQSEAGDLDSAQIPVAEEAEATTTTSTEMSGGEAPRSPRSSPRSSCPLAVTGCISGKPSDETSGNQTEERKEAESPLNDEINTNVVRLVEFLLLKYQRKELTTKAEMLDCINRDYQECYPVIFSEASECIKLFFGIDMMEVDPAARSYTLVTALGITYDGMHHGPQGMPNTGLIIMSLCIIFMEGNCVSEEKFWEVLNKLGLCAGCKHFIYDEPRKLITEDFVQEGYLEYRLVPDSDPPRHNFLWGPRAHAETTKMKVLEFFAGITKKDPSSYPTRYAEALRDEGERA
ncbi:melanoma-associated antigen 10-like [Nannospalax galili]|uniref:Melanoma-associated antigen 10-like n=1 Tax=Nannospalax galili TaxID=1026970 RepID=A0A8C6R682_NANGA|nr:melanoma-associated antigen 10-like [Nannospalax galili]